MRVTSYIGEIRRQFRDTHGVPTRQRGDREEIDFHDVPDGEYPMMIEGRLDKVRIVGGTISCCNFDDEEEMDDGR